MQSWWNILEVERDADLRTIKRAYAKKLKTIRQDEDPAAFMQLREAYEQAQNKFKHQNNNIYIPVSSSPKTRVTNFNDIEPLNEQQLPNEPTRIEQAHTLMQSEAERDKIDNWAIIFNTLSTASIDEYMEFESDFILCTIQACQAIEQESRPRKRRRNYHRKRIMSAETGKYIFDQFGWNNPNSSIQYDPEISELRTKLNAHTAHSLKPEILEAQAKMDAWDAIHNPTGKFWIIFAVFWVISLFLLLINATEQSF